MTFKVKLNFMIPPMEFDLSEELSEKIEKLLQENREMENLLPLIIRDAISESVESVILDT